MAIYVTRPFVPKRTKVNSYLDTVFKNRQLSNNGPLVRELTSRLEEYLNVKNLILVANGTLALHIAIKLFKLKGQVITTPFSFPATSSALVWEGCEPVYVDINRDSFNIDLSEKDLQIGASAILATHVFGNPCNVNEINRLCLEHSIPAIFDAAHCFGVTMDGKSILSAGNASVLSFHATKIFHTVEGGALIINDSELYEEAKRIVNFGFNERGSPQNLGINAKMNEVEAAFGLANLDEIDEIMGAYAKRYNVYDEHISELFLRQEIASNCSHNHSYFPIVCPDEKIRERVLDCLAANEIYPRRYFSPSLDTVEIFNSSENCPVSQDLSDRILCLPIYYDLPIKTVLKISKLINSTV